MQDKLLENNRILPFKPGALRHSDSVALVREDG
jgi:hypothetical protein